MANKDMKHTNYLKVLALCLIISITAAFTACSPTTTAQPPTATQPATLTHAGHIIELEAIESGGSSIKPKTYFTDDTQLLVKGHWDLGLIGPRYSIVTRETNLKARAIVSVNGRKAD